MIPALVAAAKSLKSAACKNRNYSINYKPSITYHTIPQPPEILDNLDFQAFL